LKKFFERIDYNERQKILDEEVLSDEQLENVVGGAITAKRISWYGSANNNENANCKTQHRPTQIMNFRVGNFSTCKNF